MKMPTKEEIFKKLKSDPRYNAILKKAPVQERKVIINTVDQIAGSLFDALSMALAATKEDPAASQELIEALKTGDGIIKENDGSPISKKPEEK